MGIDLIGITKVEKILERHGEKFLEKVFTDGEIKYIEEKQFMPQTVAGIYAAKEAMLKELGTGIGEYSLKDVEVFHDEKGRPYGKAGEKLFDISISHEGDYGVAVAKLVANNNLNVPDELKHLLGRRDKNSHKGTYGRVGVVAGQRGMLGSAYLSSSAAFKTGAGLVYVVVEDEIFDAMSIKATEQIVKTFEDIDAEIEFLKTMDVVLIGPGIKNNERYRTLLQKILDMDKRVVVDATVFDILRDNPLFLQGKALKILTPHEGEFSKITGLSVEEIGKHREALARDFAKRHNLTMVLKGNETVVTDGDKVYINKSGNPGMATAGSGDVLSGIVSALFKNLDPYDAASLGVYMHGSAGDFAKDIYGEESMTASDIMENIYKVFKYGNELFI